MSQSAPSGGGANRFLTVVLPFKAGQKPDRVAAAISAKDLATVTIGKVTISLREDDWKVTGNGRR